MDARHINLSSTDPAVAQTARKHLEDQMQRLRDAREVQDAAIKAARGPGGVPRQPRPSCPRRRTPATPPCRPAIAPAVRRHRFKPCRGAEGHPGREAQAARHRPASRRPAERAGRGGQQQREAHANPHFRKLAAPLETTLALRYGVKTASWTPFYDARLATGEKGAASTLAIARRASIQQKTGEDWDDVTLSLSSTRPGATTACPSCAC